MSHRDEKRDQFIFWGQRNMGDIIINAASWRSTYSANKLKRFWHNIILMPLVEKEKEYRNAISSKIQASKYKPFNDLAKCMIYKILYCYKM